MKVFYLTGSIIFTVLILILAFGNIGSQCNQVYLFFYSVDSSPTMVFLALAVLGIITGAFYHGFFSRLLAASEDEENENF